MKVVQTVRTVDKFDYRQFLEIDVDGKRQFDIGSGEPEDMTLGRDLGDAFNIVDMMKMAFDAGKAGEEFLIVKEEVEGYGD